VFFAVTKLFQHKDVHLRRMVYLVIKEFIPSSDECIIITSSLMKDMNSKNDLYRSNAIRVLCKIIDSQMLLQIERYLKQAVVDKSAVVASAVLASAMQLVGQNAEVIKRWNSEVQEAVNSKHPMVRLWRAVQRMAELERLLCVLVPQPTHTHAHTRASTHTHPAGPIPCCCPPARPSSH
jgi:coatomer protein complex subunit gamma